MRLVLDTCVLVAAVRSPGGASEALLDAALTQRVQALISTPLVLEYEATLKRQEHLNAAGFSVLEVDKLVDAICAAGTEVRIRWRWRPQLVDPGDEMVLETAINGQADAIVTFNRAHLQPAANRFGIAVLLPGEALKRV